MGSAGNLQSPVIAVVGLLDLLPGHLFTVCKRGPAFVSVVSSDLASQALRKAQKTSSPPTVSMNPGVPEYHLVPTEPHENVQQYDSSRTRVAGGTLLWAVMIVVPAIVLPIFLVRGNVIGNNTFAPFLTSSYAQQASQCGCPRLGIFPFDTACPTNCSSHRIGMGSATFYKTSSAFYFGSLDPFRKQRSPNESFHGGTRVVQTFLAQEQSVIESVMARVQEANLPPLSVHRQSIMHVSVDYLCCLTEQEMAIAKDVRARYVAGQYNSFPLELGRLQCFHERTDSVTIIWIVDALSQHLLLRASRALANAMRAEGVPVLVDRTLQMPFHSTLVGFRVSPGQDISRYRKVIHAGVEASGSYRLKTHVDFSSQLGTWRLSRNGSESHYPTFRDVKNAKWYVEEQCDS